MPRFSKAQHFVQNVFIIARIVMQLVNDLQYEYPSN